MISGIYRLTFSSGLFYIGRSDDIDRRWQEHAASFYKGTAAAIMQREYDRYGMPKFEVYFPCHQDHCDLVESGIIQFDDTNMLLNTQVPKRISAEDWITICDCQELLTASTCDHLRIIFQNTELLTQKNLEVLELRRELGTKQAEVDQLKSSGVFIGEEGHELLKFYEEQYPLLEDDLSETIGEVCELEAELKKLKGMSLWQRLFHWSW